MNRFTKFWTYIGEVVLHKTVFKGRPGDIEFFGLTEEDVPTADGQVIYYDGRIKAYKAASFHIENRYMLRMPRGRRVHEVWRQLQAIDQVNPLAVIENGKALTPYSHYDGIPSKYREVLAAAAAVVITPDIDMAAAV